MNGTNDTSIDERRLKIDEQKLTLDKERLALDRSFSKTWAPVLVSTAIPILIAIATVVISLNQVTIARRDSDLKAADYYIKVVTDTSYSKLSGNDQAILVKVLSEFFPDLYAKGTFTNLQTIVVNRIQAQPVTSSDPQEDPRYQAFSLLPSTPPSEAPPSSQYTVAIHYKSADDKNIVESVARGLREKGYNVPGIQLVTQPTNGDIRYYRSFEKSAAELLKQNVQNIIGQNQISLTLLDISKTFPNLPNGIMEVWLPDLHVRPKDG
jgi:hypothetical protein